MNVPSLTKRIERLEAAGSEAAAARYQRKVDEFCDEHGFLQMCVGGARSIEELLSMIRKVDDRS